MTLNEAITVLSSNPYDMIDGLLLEDNKSFAKKLLTLAKLPDADVEKYHNELLEIDPSKNYIVRLTKWFLENPIQSHLELIEREFKTYLEQVKKNWWKGDDVKIKDIRHFDKFEKFTAEVHRIEAKYNIKHNKNCEVVDNGSTLTIFGKTIDKRDVTLKKDDVIVVHAPNMRKSIQYGDGFSNWCTARNSANYFYQYRFGTYGGTGDSSLYYVYFPNRCNINVNDNEKVLHFGVNEEGKISYTDISNRESVQTLEWLKSTFKEFKGIDMKSVFKFHAPDQKEKEIVNFSNNLSDENFKELSDIEQTIYITSGERIINLEKFEAMNAENREHWLKICDINKGYFDMEIVEKYPENQYVRRFINFLKTGDSDKIDELVLSLYDKKNIELLIKYLDFKKLDPYTIKSLLSDSPDKEKTIDMMLSKGLTIIDILSYNNIQSILFNASDKQKVIEYLLNKNIPLTYSNMEDLLSSSEDVQKTIDIILSKNIELKKPTINRLLEHSPDKEKIINYLLSKGITIDELLSADNITLLLRSSKFLEKTIDMLLNKGITIDKIFTAININTLLLMSKISDSQNVVDVFLNKNIPLTPVNIKTLLFNSTDLGKTIDTLLNKGLTIDKILNDENVEKLIDFSLNKEKTIDALLSKGLSIDEILTEKNLKTIMYRSVNREKTINYLLNKNISPTYENLKYLTTGAYTTMQKVIEYFLNRNIPLTDETIEHVLYYSQDKIKIIENLLNKGLTVDKILTDDNVKNIFTHIDAPPEYIKELIYYLLRINIPLTDRNLNLLVYYSPDLEKTINELLNKGLSIDKILTDKVIGSLLYSNSPQDKEYVINILLNKNVPLNDSIIDHLLAYAEDTEKIINYISSKGLVLNNVLNDITLESLIFNSNNRKQTIDILVKHGIPIDRILTVKVVEYLLYNSTLESQEYRDELITYLISKPFPLTDKIINSLINNFSNKQQIIDYILSKNISLTDSIIEKMLNNSADLEKTINGLLNKKLPIDKILADRNVKSLLINRFLNLGETIDILLSKGLSINKILNADNLKSLLDSMFFHPSKSKYRQSTFEILFNKNVPLTHDNIQILKYYSPYEPDIIQAKIDALQAKQQGLTERHFNYKSFFRYL